MPGPAPKPAEHRRRRNASPGALRLPSSGRSGPAPAWPLGGKVPAVWPELWRMPQAVAWERLHLTRIVARYAAKLTEAEQPEAGAAIQAEVRQVEDRLGLSPMAMLRLRWEIDEAPAEQTTSAGVTAIDQYRRDVGA